MIDSSIALGVKPFQPEDGLNSLAQILKIQNGQQTNKLNELLMAGKQREYDDTTKLNSLYSSAIGADGKVDRSAVLRGAATGGLGSKIPGLQKDFTDSDEATGRVDAQKFKLANERHGVWQKAMTALAQEPNLTKDMVMQSGQGLVDQGILPLELFQKSAATMPDDPIQLRARIMQGTKAQMSPEQIFTIFAPKPEKIDNGQQISFRDTNPNSPTYGQATGGAGVQKQQTPDSVASVGAQYANASATREVARATRDAAQIKGNQDTEMKLGDDYRAQSKNFKETADAYKQISAVLDKAATSPAATLAGATKFMKMIDPGSVVRESELGMALAATGVFDRATNYFNTLQNGKVLTANQVKDFKAITKQINDAASQQQGLIDSHFSQVAKQYGLRPEMVIQDYGQGASPKTTGKPSVSNW